MSELGAQRVANITIRQIHSAENSNGTTLGSLSALISPESQLRRQLAQTRRSHSGLRNDALREPKATIQQKCAELWPRLPTNEQEAQGHPRSQPQSRTNVRNDKATIRHFGVALEPFLAKALCDEASAPRFTLTVNTGL